MAKKKKGGISRKLPPVGTTQRPKRELPGETILERFRALEDIFNGPVPKRELADFMVQENRKAVRQSQEEEMSNLGEECSALLRYLMSNYDDSMLLVTRDKAPFLVETAMNYLEEIKDTGDLTEEQYDRANNLGNWIFDIEADRTCTFFVGESDDRKVIRLPRNIPYREQDDLYSDLEETIIVFMEKDGTLVLRYASGTPGKDIVNGFRLTMDRFTKIPVRELKRILETRPDGTRSPDPTVLYGEADVDLDVEPEDEPEEEVESTSETREEVGGPQLHLVESNGLPNRDLPGETILERFQALEDLFPGMVPKREVAGFLAQENLKSFLRFQERQMLGLGAECKEFFLYLAGNYSESYFNLAEKHAPFLVEPAMHYVEEVKDPGGLTDEQRRRARALADYIFRIRRDRLCTFFLGITGGYKVVDLPRVIPRKKLDDMYAELEETVEEAMLREGSLVLRYASGAGKQILNGFRLTPGRIKKIPVDFLRMTQETMPDGSHSPDPTAIYQEADVEFP